MPPGTAPDEPNQPEIDRRRPQDRDNEGQQGGTHGGRTGTPSHTPEPPPRNPVREPGETVPKRDQV
jgi:hypothetical protein